MSTARELFDTVPKSDPLELFENNQPNYEKIVGFLEFKREEVSRATSAPLSSIRYDRLPRELQDRITEWGVAYNLVAEFFGGDAYKTAMWFKMPNPLLGNMSPRDMIRFGRFKKLLKFIHNSLDENRR